MVRPAEQPVADYRVRVLNVSEPSPRKNLTGLVRTWISATSADADEEAAAQALQNAIDGRDRPAEILAELHAGQRLPS